MKTFKRLITLSLICIISTLILSLFSCEKGYEYRWTYFFAENTNENEISKNDSIKKENYGINIHFFHRRYLAVTETPFINKTYAAIDLKSNYTNRDTIVDIRVFTLSDFNSEYDSLNNVTELFKNRNPYDSSLLDLQSYTHQLNRNLNRLLTEFDMVLDSVEAYPKKHQFLIEIELSDNRILKDTTQNITLY